jgi:hypothetical protein
MRILFLTLFFLFIPSLCNSNEDQNYGYKIPYTPLYIGGYLSAEYDKEKHDTLFFDDIALLFYANIGKYHLLGEVEAADIPLDGSKNSDIRLYIERIEISYHIDEYSTLAFGKFNSDIGFWNLAPINTLTDTTTPPYLMQDTFPELTTGLLYTHSFSDEEQILSFIFQHNSDIDKQYNNMEVDKHYGIGYTYYGQICTWRMNGGYYHNKRDNNSFYGGISYQKESTYWTLQGELFTKQSAKNHDVPYNIYAQFTNHIANQHDLIFRQEFYKDNFLHIKEGISLIGYTYRPRPFIAIKGEYVKHSSLPKNRLVFSFSVVF